MALTERQEERLEILHDGMIQVLTVTIIERDGAEVSRSNHRYVVDVEDDLTGKSNRLQAVAAATWTPEVKADRAEQRRVAKGNAS